MRQKRRIGMSVRVVSHARPVPSTAVEADTRTASWMVRQRGSRVRRDASMVNGDAEPPMTRQTT